MRSIPDNITYYLGKGLISHATLKGSGIMHIEGTFYGNITGDILITGRDSVLIDSTVEAHTVIIAGHFSGNISVHSKISILHCANVRGTIVAPLCDVEHGAKIHAHMKIKK